MSWYKMSFTANEVANGKHMGMLNTFSDLFFKSGGPKDLVMLSPIKHRGKDFPYIMHVPTKYKFIAELFSIIYSSIPCEKPVLSSLSVERGNADFASHIS